MYYSSSKTWDPINTLITISHKVTYVGEEPHQ